MSRLSVKVMFLPGEISRLAKVLCRRKTMEELEKSDGSRFK